MIAVPSASLAVIAHSMVLLYSELFALHSVQELEKREAPRGNRNKIIHLYQHIVPGMKFWKIRNNSEKHNNLYSTFNTCGFQNKEKQ